MVRVGAIPHCRLRLQSPTPRFTSHPGSVQNRANLEEGTTMCLLCDQGKPQNHSRSQLGRRDFLKASSAAAAGAAGPNSSLM